MYLWSKKGGYLSSTLDLKNKSNESIYQYMSFIDQWKMISHPFLFQIDNTEVKEKKLGNKNIIDIKIKIKNIDFFNLTQKTPNNLSLIDKISLIRDLMLINDIAIRNGLDIFWHYSMLRISKVGQYIFWLPQPPKLWWEKSNAGNNKISIIYIFFDLFNIQYKEEDNVLEKIIDLERNEKIPWGWSTFIQYYLNNSIYNDDLFSAIFYKIWLYRTANRLGMTDQSLTLKEYNRLHKFGEQLDLSNQQMDFLDVISQKDEHQKLGELWLKNFLKNQE